MFLIYYHMVSDPSHPILTDTEITKTPLVSTQEGHLPLGTAWELKILFHFRLWRARNLVILICNSYLEHPLCFISHNQALPVTTWHRERPPKVTYSQKMVVSI